MIVGEIKSLAKYCIKTFMSSVCLEIEYKFPPSQKIRGEKEIEIKTNETKPRIKETKKVCKGAFLNIEKLFLKASLILLPSMIAAG